MLPASQHQTRSSDTTQDDLFTRIASDLFEQGFSVQPGALPYSLALALFGHLRQMRPEQFAPAGIGRQQDYMTNQFVRTDEISWINGESAAGREWLHWCGELQAFLNQRLFLGLFSFESHFAHYRPGDFYKRHTDAFRGEANRVLSVVAYLNPAWSVQDGGELVLYRDEADMRGCRVSPDWGTLVTFLSEEFPHEVLPATRDRYSIAGWFRVNTSVANCIDPPR